MSQNLSESLPEAFTLCAQANAQRLAGEFESALQSYVRALLLDPLNSKAFDGLGLTLFRLGRPKASLKAFQRAVELDPISAEIHFNYGTLLAECRNYEASINNLEIAIRLAPDFAEAYNNLGVTYEALGRYYLAEQVYQKAIDICPRYTDAQSNLDRLRSMEGDGEALARLEDIVRRDPSSPRAHWNLSFAYLLHDNYERGWEEYEWRRRCPDYVWAKKYQDQPEWCGELLNDKWIFIHSEQGLGDTIQFSRYLPLVAKAGGLVIIEVQKELKRWISGIPGVSICISRGEAVPHFDLHCPLMSLPRLFGTTIQTVPMIVSPERFATRGHSEDFCNDTVMRIGLCWSGNPAHPRDGLRSMCLGHFAGLACRDKIKLYSLQYRLTPQERAQLEESGIADGCSGASDLSDTANLIAQLDLVITVDTSIAHLAGSMSRPVWILLSAIPDWRWGMKGIKSTWYPSARLFRQVIPGEWGTVIKEMEENLLSFSHCNR